MAEPRVRMPAGTAPPAFPGSGSRAQKRVAYRAAPLAPPIPGYGILGYWGAFRRPCSVSSYNGERVSVVRWAYGRVGVPQTRHHGRPCGSMVATLERIHIRRLGGDLAGS